ncbi:hypothetical protein ANCDUO_23343 [Ancylostoma duodenale]|uniref:glucuronosyltransferase n=1 Tax=Ancylostoma duodenale TaxID=51022 RepID=A0A0C2BRY5_9BILA|nr:hypothetical protein ANCDUO_23343 [Ancylostoma duodenale]
MHVFEAFSGSAFEESSLYEEHKGLLQYETAYNELCEDLINRENVVEQLRAEQFEAYFGEQINLCPITDYMAWVLGMPQPSSYIPSLVGMDTTNKMSYLERVRNIYSTLLYVYFMENSVEETTEVFRRKYGAHFPNLGNIAADSDMIFVSTDEFIEFPRPTLPNVVHIGGLGFRENIGDYVLSEPYLEEMEKGEKGMVYLSFGTVVNTTSLPKFAMTAVIETVKQTPDYHFIVAVDTYDQPGGTPRFSFIPDLSHSSADDTLSVTEGRHRPNKEAALIPAFVM